MPLRAILGFLPPHDALIIFSLFSSKTPQLPPDPAVPGD